MILATKRSDFDALIEAAIFMSPLLEEQHSRMNMRKTRYLYYGSSAMPERTTAAIKEAGITLVTKDSTTSGDGAESIIMSTAYQLVQTAKRSHRWSCKTQLKKPRA